jgi:hypothetical protein
MNLLTKAHPNNVVFMCVSLKATIFHVVKNVATKEMGNEWLKA